MVIQTFSNCILTFIGSNFDQLKLIHISELVFKFTVFIQKEKGFQRNNSLKKGRNFGEINYQKNRWVFLLLTLNSYK